MVSTQPHPVQAGGALYSVFDDCVTHFAALITGSVTDDALGTFRCEGFTMDTARHDLTAKTLPTGLYAIMGYAGRSFPRLALQSYTVSIVCKAPGFRDVSLDVTVPQNAVFPVAVPGIVMRQQPVLVQGRVVDDVTRLPVAGALIESMDTPLPTLPPSTRAVALRTPVYGSHPGGSPVQTVTMPVVGTASLTQDARAGALGLNLSTRAGLAAGSVVRLANASETLVEYVVVDQMGPGAPGAAGTVSLFNALGRTYFAGGATTAQFVQPTAKGGPLTLQSAAFAGDGILLITGLPPGGTLAIDMPTLGSAEYHEIGAVTDADGNYVISGVGHARELFLRASKGAKHATQHWFVDYDRSLNLVDFRLG